jgi:hypothetical protein
MISSTEEEQEEVRELITLKEKKGCFLLSNSE